MHILLMAVVASLATAASPVLATTYHVAPDSSGDVLNIQAAIEAASNGDVIELADGLFTGPGNWDLNLGSKELTVRSQHGAAATAIDGGYPSDVWATHQGFIIQGGQTSATVIEDLTVQGVATPQEGGAIVCVGASPLIRNVRVTGNRFAARGVALFEQGGTPVVQDCVFEGNGPTESAICSRESWLTLERCTIRGCPCWYVVDLDGGVLTDCVLEQNGSMGNDPNLLVYAESGDVSLVRCRLADGFSEGIRVGPQARLVVASCAFDSLNGNGGTGISGSGSAIVRGTTFRRLQAQYTESVIEWWRSEGSLGSLSLDHCVFVRNNSFGWTGGVIYVNNATVSVSHCTFAWNHTQYQGPSVIDLRGDSNLSMDNTIVAFNTHGGAPLGTVTCEERSTVDIRCTDIFGNVGGDWGLCVADFLGKYGNLSEDPLFCTDFSDQVSLQPNSPCAAANSGECGLIGAWGVACGPTALQEHSWGSIKALYR